MRTPSQGVARTPRSERERLAGALAKLPSPDDPSFADVAEDVVNGIGNPEALLRQLVEDRAQRHRLRFAALYALLTRLHREERYSEYGTLVRRYEGEFGNEPYFRTFKAVLARVRGDLGSLRSAVEYARQAAELMPRTPEVVHRFAAYWIEYVERLGIPAADRDLDDIERHVDRAIAMSHGSVAGYLETKARVLAIRGEFEAARSAVAQAIEIEPCGSHDYLRRVTQYQSTRVRIDLMEERARWMQTRQQFRAELTEFKGQQLQLLGLLAASIAFIVTAGSIASRASGAEAIRLIVAASGAVAVAFGTFSLLNNSSTFRVLITIAIGSALIIGGILLPASWLQ